jgi:hypothetical protein
MPPRNRSAGRNVHIYYNKKDQGTSVLFLLGGLILSTGVTNANLYAMIRIFVKFQPHSHSDTFSLRDQDRIRIQENNLPLRPGNYYIITTGKFLRYPFMH